VTTGLSLNDIGVTSGVVADMDARRTEVLATGIKESDQTILADGGIPTVPSLPVAQGFSLAHDRFHRRAS
jgi:hypothetical protein